MNQFNQYQTFFKYIFEIDEILVFMSFNSTYANLYFFIIIKLYRY